MIMMSLPKMRSELKVNFVNLQGCIDKLRKQVERRKRHRLKELEFNSKANRKKVTKTSQKNKVSLEEILKKHYIDHNGKMVQKNAIPIKYDTLPGFYRKALNHSVEEHPLIEKSGLSDSLYKIKSSAKYFSSKYKLPEVFQDHMTEVEPAETLDDNIEPSFGVKMITSTGERRVGKMSQSMTIGQTMMSPNSARKFTATDTVGLSHSYFYLGPTEHI